MSRLAVILWVSLISIQAFYQGLIYTYYVYNKAYIIEQLCENKNQPSLKCDGKCHLRKALSIKKQTPVKEQQPFLPSLEDIKPPVLFLQATIKASLDVLKQGHSLLQETIAFEYCFDYAYQPIFSFLQPPRLS